MSKSLADNPFITEAKDKNGDSWYHQIILEKKDKEIEKLKSIIKEVREYVIQETNTINAITYINILEILEKENKDGER